MGGLLPIDGQIQLGMVDLPLGQSGAERAIPHPELVDGDVTGVSRTGIIGTDDTNSRLADPAVHKAVNTDIGLVPLIAMVPGSDKNRNPLAPVPRLGANGPAIRPPHVVAKLQVGVHAGDVVARGQES